MFFGIVIGEFAFGHDALEDAVGAIADIHVLLQVGCLIDAIGPIAATYAPLRVVAYGI